MAEATRALLAQQMPTGEGAPTVVVIEGKRRVNWRRVKELLPWGRTPDELARRKQMFKLCDVNGNGIISLAEVDKALRDCLNLDEIFNCKPVIIRAFNAVKGAHQGIPPPGNLGERTRALKVDPVDYVELSEFRLLMAYLYGYFELWELFEIIDASGDRRISLQEFEQAVPLLQRMGVKIASPAATFNEIDGDGAGMILFKEFSDWALKINLNDHIGHGEYE
jgi:Ca2+-binding EF-hand superfamily protein